MSRFPVSMNVFLVFCLTAVLCHAQTIPSGRVLLDKTGPITLTHSVPLVLEFHEYSKCVGIFKLCYLAYDKSRAEEKCGPESCLLTLEKSNPFTNTILTSDAGIATLSFDTLINDCSPNVFLSTQSYKVLELFTGCKVYAKSETEAVGESELSTTKTTTNSEHGGVPKVVIYVVCGVIGFLIIGATGFLLVWCCCRQSRQNEAARNRRQSQVATNNAEGVNLLAVTTTTSMPSTTTTTATNTDQPKAEKVSTKPVVTTSGSNVAPQKNSVNTPLPTPEKTKVEEAPVESKMKTKTDEVSVAQQMKVRRFRDMLAAQRSLRAQKTQDSPTGSEGTPPTDRIIATSMKKSSMFVGKHYVPNNQSHVPYRRKKKLDSMEQLFPVAESVLASFERQKHVSKTTQMVVAGRWKLDVDHDLHLFEKHVLRDVIDVAFPALIKLIGYLDSLLINHGAVYGLNDSSESTWEYVNRTDVPASAAMRLLMMSYPSIVDGLEPQMRNSVIAELSVPAMYALLFSDKFDNQFKKEVIIELRARACIIFRDVPLNNLLSSPHPLPYLARRFKANRGDFIIGIVPKMDFTVNGLSTQDA